MTARHPYFDHPGPIAFAHRGGALEAPENTLAAFGHAVSLGFRYIETDVQVTADGRVVVFHDDRLDRLTDRRGPVRALPWAELRQARIAGREPIPLLEEVLEAWPDLRLNIDPKVEAAAMPLADLLERTGSLHRVCLGSFSEARLHRLRARLGPGLATSCGPWGVLGLRLRGLGLPWPAPAGRCAQVPPSHHGIPVVVPGFLRAAHDLGMPVHVWTVDDAAEMERLLDLGVDGIMTDRPTLLRQVMRRRGLWPS